MNTMLQDAEFGGTPVDPAASAPLIGQANALIAGATCP